MTTPQQSSYVAALRPVVPPAGCQEYTPEQEAELDQLHEKWVAAQWTDNEAATMRAYVDRRAYFQRVNMLRGL